MQDKVGAVLVVGAGVGGLRAALDMAESGFRAYLVDSNPGIGGTAPQLDKWFPDNGCELCKLLPVFSLISFHVFNPWAASISSKLIPLSAKNALALAQKGHPSVK